MIWQGLLETVIYLVCSFVLFWIGKLVYDLTTPSYRIKEELVEKDNATAGQFVKRLREHLKFMPYAPILFASAKTGQRAHRLLPFVDRVVANHRRRIQTAELNRFLAEALHRHELPIHRTRRVKLFYLSQVATAPPTFVGIANYPDAIHFSYHRYLINGLRETFDFEGTPIRLLFKPRSRRRQRRGREPDDAKGSAQE